MRYASQIFSANVYMAQTNLHVFLLIDSLSRTNSVSYDLYSMDFGEKNYFFLIKNIFSMVVESGPGIRFADLFIKLYLQP